MGEKADTGGNNPFWGGYNKEQPPAWAVVTGLSRTLPFEVIPVTDQRVQTEEADQIRKGYKTFYTAHPWNPGFKEAFIWASRNSKPPLNHQQDMSAIPNTPWGVSNLMYQVTTQAKTDIVSEAAQRGARRAVRHVLKRLPGMYQLNAHMKNPAIIGVAGICLGLGFEFLKEVSTKDED